MVENRERKFNEGLCGRVHRLRKERGVTAEEMAIMLGVPPDRYRKYEYRSPLPHYLIEQFALIVGRDLEYVLTGNTSRRTVLAEVKKSPNASESRESRRKRA
jgi:transcriptional regulator with XRE-family HTH domain